MHPGIIDTPLAYHPSTNELLVNLDDLPMPRPADVDEISAMVLFVASDDARYCTGAEFVADGGFLLGPVKR